MSEENNQQNDKNPIVEKAKQEAKAKVKQKVIALAIKILMPVILIIFAGALVLGVFNAVGDAVQKIVEGIVDFFTIDHEGAIVISDEQIDTIINGISGLGVSIDGLKLMGDVDYNDPDIQEANRKALRRYIKEFYEAQAMTQTLNTKPGWFESWTAGDKPYGTVYVYRANGEDTITKTSGTQLAYIPYEEMVKKQQAGDSSITRYFSVNEKGELVIAGSSSETVKQNGKTSSQSYVSLKNINYKNAISQYTTSMNFFLYLAMITQNPEFVSAVTDLVKQSDIRITILDNVTTTTTKETYTYTLNTETKQNNTATNTTTPTTTTTQQTVTETTETTTVSRNPKVAITYAKTWFSEQTITYTKKQTGPTTNSGTVTDTDDPKPSIGQNNSVSWKTNKQTSYSTTTTTTSYEEGTRGDVIDRTGEKGDGKKSFIGLLDVEFKIPNTTRYDTAGGNLVSGAEMFFYLLQKDSASQNLEQIMRYILNKYQNTNKYGNISFEDIAGNYEIRMITTGSNYIVNTSISPAELCITDEKVLQDAVAKVYSGEMKNNLTSEAKNFIDMQSKYHVNAVFAMAVTVVESGAGTGWAAIDRSTYNWYSITGSYKGKTYRNPNSSNPRTWRVYPSFKEATFDFGDLIANSSYYFKAGKNSVEEIAPTYCDEAWGKSVISVMNEIYEAAGIQIPTEMGDGFTAGGITTDSEAQELENYIENELLHTKIHKNNSAYQNGPFAKWWSTPYNMLSKFQCTWWANGRASMYLEQYGTKYKKYPTQRGNGGDYYNVNKQNGWFKYGNTPKPNSIISWRVPGSYGHVAYVEGVTADGIYISHAGSGKSWFGIQKIPLNGSIWNGYILNGYIYLDEPN